MIITKQKNTARLGDLVTTTNGKYNLIINYYTGNKFALLDIESSSVTSLLYDTIEELIESNEVVRLIPKYDLELIIHE